MNELPDTYRKLLDAARASVAQAFLTSPGNTAYGAAALTVEGNIFRSGQYSSFNHITNVHAEQAALLLATMAGQPDVVALAIATTAPATQYARPCGICRQVMAEHAQRTGRDFDVLMAAHHGQSCEIKRVSELLPHAWRAAGASEPVLSPAIDADQSPLQSSPIRWPLRTGDQLLLRDGSLAVVWDPLFDEELALVRVILCRTGDRWHGVPDPYLTPIAYQGQLADRGRWMTARCGARGAFVSLRDVAAVTAAQPLRVAKREHWQPLLDALLDADIGEDQVTISQTHGPAGVHAAAYCLIVVRADEPTVRWVEAALQQQFQVATELSAVSRSAAEKHGLQKALPGGIDRAHRLGRFIHLYAWPTETVELIFTPTRCGEPCLGEGWKVIGHTSIYGTVTEASNASFVRGRFQVLTAEGPFEVVTYHPLARLIRRGDCVSLSGTLVTNRGRYCLLQMHLSPDRTVWWQTATDGVLPKPDR